MMLLSELRVDRLAQSCYTQTQLRSIRPMAPIKYGVIDASCASGKRAPMSHTVELDLAGCHVGKRRAQFYFS